MMCRGIGTSTRAVFPHRSCWRQGRGFFSVHCNDRWSARRSRLEGGWPAAALEPGACSVGHEACGLEANPVWLPPKPAGTLDISDILIFEPGESEVRDLSQAVPPAVGGNVTARAKLGVYWEVYGLAKGEVRCRCH